MRVQAAVVVHAAGALRTLCHVGGGVGVAMNRRFNMQRKDNMNDEPTLESALQPSVVVDLATTRSAPRDRVGGGMGSDTSIAVVESNSDLSTERLCSFSGMISCTHVAINAVQMLVSLTNTSDVERGRYLTGFMFRMPRELGGFSVALLRSS